MKVAWTPTTERLPIVGQTVIAYGRFKGLPRWRVRHDHVAFVHGRHAFWGCFDEVSHWVAFEDLEGPQ